MTDYYEEKAKKALREYEKALGRQKEVHAQYIASGPAPQEGPIQAPPKVLDMKGYGEMEQVDKEVTEAHERWQTALLDWARSRAIRGK